MLLNNSTTITTRSHVQVVHIDNDFASAQISLFGGHLLSYQPKHDNKERLWVSENAIFDGKKAIRGGVPICWPWFGGHALRQDVADHGYVRTQTWEIVETEELNTGTKLVLQPQTSIGEGFDSSAQLKLVITVGKQLNIQLHTTNVGDNAFTYNCALHSYFAIDNINHCELEGLSGQYSDKTQQHQIFTTPSPYTFSAETDRVHLGQPHKLSIVDTGIHTDITSNGHDSIVVWNPWQNKSISMADMADDSFKSMLCVETAITQGQKVKAGETHILEQIIT
jgi:glucose-6-phosphate 1-epimerase